MRALLLLSLALTSCSYQAIEETKISTLETIKPGIRAHVVPGTTYGNVVLQNQTVEAAKDVLTVNATLPECSTAQMKVSDTWPLGSPVPSKHSDAFLRWKELWTFETCGNSVDAEIVYMLHRKSGIINFDVSLLYEGQAVKLPSPS